MKLKDKRLFLLDMDGTIYLDQELFDGTLDFLEYVEKISGRAMYLTNNSSKSVTKYIEKLDSMGIKAEKKDFTTSAQATALYLQETHKNDLIYVFGTQALKDEFKEYGLNITDKDKFCWISMIRQPEFVTEQVVETAKAAMKKKKPGVDTSKAELVKIKEGLCVQIMHKGSYDDEPESIKKLKEFVAENGYTEDFSENRYHHEIYLSDPRKCDPEKLKTVIRHPVKIVK